MLKDFSKRVFFALIEFLQIACLFYFLGALIVQTLDDEFSFDCFGAALLIFSSSLFFQSRVFFYKCFALLFFVFASIWGIKWFLGEAVSWWEYSSFTATGVALINIVLLLVAWMNQTRFLKWFTGVPVLLFCFPLLFLWGYYFSSETSLSVEAVLAVLQTNADEGKEYLFTFLTVSDWVLLGVAFAAVLFVVWFTRTLRVKQMNPFYAFMMTIALLAANMAGIHLWRKNMVVNMFETVQFFLNEYEDFKAQKDERMAQIKEQLLLADDVPAGLYVLVIGESQNRMHMSAYGYERETTPWLNKMKDNPNFVLFSNAYSCHVHTVPALNYALTLKNQYNTVDLADSFSIIDVASAAGFETVWISNQAKIGRCETPASIIASGADKQFWYNHLTCETGTPSQHYDEKLLEAVADIKTSDKMLIVFHLMGNHFAYDRRYPSDFKKFKGGSKQVDAYDNSMLYNDYVVEKIYDVFVQNPHFKGLIYFADHAESLKDKDGHNSSRFTFDMARIPLYFYFSDDYKQAYPERFNQLMRARDFVFTNDLLFNAVLGVMGIRLSDFYEPQNDITSETYDATVDRFLTMYGKEKIAADGF